jgi:hypothetical protein
MGHSYAVEVMMKQVVVIMILLSFIAGCARPDNTLTGRQQTPIIVDNKSTQVPVSTAPPSDNKTNQIVEDTAANQGTLLQGIPVNLRYDYLNTEENLSNQVAVWHSYATASAPNWGIAGTWVETPLIILPNKEGAVCIIKDTYGSSGYKYLQIDTTSYRDTVDEKVELNKPAWGLATTFHPDKTPFTINNIKIAGVANYTTGLVDDYNKKYLAVNILNGKSEIIWSKYYKWSDFRNTNTSSLLPNAVWRDIAVDNVTVDGDFTIDVLALSDTYNKTGDMYSYFAVAYEKLAKCEDIPTNSFISGNGKRYTPYIRLYDQYGNPVCFNLCIRVDGIY